MSIYEVEFKEEDQWERAFIVECSPENTRILINLFSANPKARLRLSTGNVLDEDVHYFDDEMIDLLGKVL